jgi:hypothetical protein
MGSCGCCTNRQKFVALVDIDGNNSNTDVGPMKINERIKKDEMPCSVAQVGDKLKSNWPNLKVKENRPPIVYSEESTEVMKSSSLKTSGSVSKKVTFSFDTKPPIKSFKAKSSSKESLEKQPKNLASTPESESQGYESTPQSESHDCDSCWTRKVFDGRANLPSSSTSAINSQWITVRSAAVPRYSWAVKTSHSVPAAPLPSISENISIQMKTRQLFDNNKDFDPQVHRSRESLQDLTSYISGDDGGSKAHMSISQDSYRSVVADEIERKCCTNQRECRGIMS